jgi:hypothetical protein
MSEQPTKRIIQQIGRDTAPPPSTPEEMQQRLEEILRDVIDAYYSSPRPKRVVIELEEFR